MRRARLTRREFARASAGAAGSLYLLPPAAGAARRVQPGAPAAPASAASLPVGNAPAPVPFPHFPDRLHAFVWRNWQLVPPERMADVLGTEAREIVRLGRSMGLSPATVTPEQQRRSHLTVIRRNWHLLPYEQLLTLLGWTADQLAYALREDDFLFVKLGNHKPKCEPLTFREPGPAARTRALEIGRLVRREFGAEPGKIREPLFRFVSELSAAPAGDSRPVPSAFSPRFCHSYFALFGDPLLEPDLDPYPDGYLARLAASGVDGIWLHIVLSRMSPFPWDAKVSDRFEQRRRGLLALVARAKRHGISVYLYFNEPRAMPLAFFEKHPGLKGVVEGDHATLCTSTPEVQEYLTEAIASLCKAVPGIGGFFTITASENLTNCWSHHRGAGCPRCGKRAAADVIVEVNALVLAGIRKAKSSARLLTWDWGWEDAWALQAIARLPREAALMSVSEWSLPVRRGGVETTVGEYSISAVGPGPRAQRHWAAARERGLKTLAKMQAGNSWELSAVPYIPAVANVARHAANVRAQKVDGLMLGWTLGGYPSPNLEVVAEIGRDPAVSPEQAMAAVARRRFGAEIAPAVVDAWGRFSTAFSEFPYHAGVVYNAPLQVGPANLLWETPTGYRATMVGIPYDDLDGWRQVYPAGVFISQLERVADGFDEALEMLRKAIPRRSKNAQHAQALAAEMRVGEAASLHFRSVALQAKFVSARRALAAERDPAARGRLCDVIQQTLEKEIELAGRLHDLQQRDSRLGFESSNQYYYVPLDLAEKVLNCRDLLDRWLPTQRPAA